jgi:hypothetical protein
VSDALSICTHALERQLASRPDAATLRERLLSPASTEALTALFGRLPRLLGKGPAGFTAEEQRRIGFPVAEWTLDLLARVVLLAQAERALSAQAFADALDSLYRHGEARERAAVLRALPLLSEPARFAELAADACRTHVLPVFEAIACENPYPAAYFSDETFRQMVLKAVFVEVQVARILGLEGRVDAELARMVGAYVSERRAAGRSVSDDALRLSGEASTN